MLKSSQWMVQLVAAVAASLAFIIGVMLSVKLIIVAGTGDVTIPVIGNFLKAFDIEKMARLIFGLSLAALAITLTVEFLFSRLRLTFESVFVANTAAYFTGSFVVILVSSLSLFVDEFAANPITLSVAFIFITICSFMAALVYGAVGSVAPKSSQVS